MPASGLQRLLDFVDFLKTERISFAISYKGEGSITVDFGLRASGSRRISTRIT